jgi:serine protease Do
MKSGCVTRGYLGVVIQELTPELAASFGLDGQRGILVAQVSEDSPAERAGLKRGDVIVEFEGKPVEKIGPFRNRVALEAPGTSERLVVLREGKRKAVTVTIGTLPEEAGALARQYRDTDALGLTVETLTPVRAEQFGLQGQKGVVVTQVRAGSAAARAGIQVGTVIQEANRRPIRSVDDFKHAVASVPKHGVVLLLVKTGTYSRYVTLKTE